LGWPSRALVWSRPHECHVRRRMHISLRRRRAPAPRLGACTLAAKSRVDAEVSGEVRRREETKPVGSAVRLRRLPPTPPRPEVRRAVGSTNRQNCRLLRVGRVTLPLSAGRGYAEPRFRTATSGSTTRSLVSDCAVAVAERTRGRPPVRMGNARVGAPRAWSQPRWPCGPVQAITVAIWWRWSLVRLRLIVISRHSVRTASLPLRWNRSNLRLCLV
jgi:hypothetical protein